MTEFHFIGTFAGCGAEIELSVSSNTLNSIVDGIWNGPASEVYGLVYAEIRIQVYT